MKANLAISLPKFITNAFPALAGARYIRTLAPLVPLYPDTAYHLFCSENGRLYALVATDHPDPAHQAQELEQLSGELQFECLHLLKPHDNDSLIAIRAFDEMDESFSIGDSGSHWRYYVAEVQRIG